MKSEFTLEQEAILFLYFELSQLSSSHSKTVSTKNYYESLITWQVLIQLEKHPCGKS